MNNPVDTLYPLPERNAPAAGAVDSSPKALRKWVETLPIGSPELCASRILDVVYKINRLIIDDHDRAHFIDAVSQVAIPILRTLARKLRDVAAPPSKKEIQIAEAAILLHQELALAHRGMLEHKAGRKNLFSKGLQIDPLHHVYRGLYHLCQSLKIHYFINVEPLDDVWGKLNGLYAMLDEDGTQATPSKPIPDESFHCPDEVFKTAILMHLSDPNALRGDELDYLSTLLPELSKQAPLLPASSIDGFKPSRSYLLKLTNVGGPPSLYGVSKCEECPQGSECLVLDVTPLVKSVRRRIADMETDEVAHNPQLVNEYNVLSHINKRLGVRLKRQSKRLHGDHSVDVIAGLTQAHDYFTGGVGSSLPFQAAPEAEPPNASSGSSIKYNMHLNLELVSIDTPGAKGSSDASRKDNGSRQQLRRTRCMTLNFSQGGYCLMAGKSDVFRLNTGEFIAVREQDSDRWLPACVSWLSTDGENLHFGVRLMAPHMRAGKAICHENEETQATECLLLFDRDTDALPSRILLSPSNVPDRPELRVEFGKLAADLLLGHKLTHTHGFIEFDCKRVSVKQISPETQASFRGARDESEQASPAPGDSTDTQHAGTAPVPPWKRFQ